MYIERGEAVTVLTGELTLRILFTFSSGDRLQQLENFSQNKHQNILPFPPVVRGPHGVMVTWLLKPYIYIYIYI